MRAVILAAGRGSRLKPHTDETPKPLLPIGDTTLIHRTVTILRRLAVADITIVIGYLKQRFIEAFPEGVRFCVNDDYERTDQAASLLKARDEFRDDVLVVTGDLFCPENVFADMAAETSPVSVAVDRSAKAFDDRLEKVLFHHDRIVRIGKLNVDNAEANGEFLGMTKFHKDACSAALQRLERAVQRDPRSALIHVHQDLIDEGHALRYVECREEWCEVDDVDGLGKARRMFASHDVRV